MKNWKQETGNKEAGVRKGISPFGGGTGGGFLKQ